MASSIAPISNNAATIPSDNAPLPKAVTQAKAIDNAGRRQSIQFKPLSSLDLPTGSPKATRPGGRRLSSPPPPPTFVPRVSFDTFDKPADFIEENSFTLSYKHRDYEYTKRSRTFLCGIDSNDYSEYALDWLIDELVDDGDEIVCLRVVETNEKVATSSSIEKQKYKTEAEAMMENIQEKNKENKAIHLVLEFAVGKVNRVIDEMINLYEPAILVVGTRGRSLGGFQGLLPGSVSKYCLQHSPVPVIVVRPNSKRAKAKMKRLDDTSRQVYRDILDKSEVGGGHPLHFDSNSTYFTESQAASEDEAAAVAAAVGYKSPADQQQHPLSKVQTTGSVYSSSSVAVESVGGSSIAEASEDRDQSAESPGDSPSPTDNDVGGVSIGTSAAPSQTASTPQGQTPSNTLLTATDGGAPVNSDSTVGPSEQVPAQPDTMQPNIAQTTTVDTEAQGQPVNRESHKDEVEKKIEGEG